jgi:hypothetical protein
MEQSLSAHRKKVIVASVISGLIIIGVIAAIMAINKDQTNVSPQDIDSPEPNSIDTPTNDAVKSNNSPNGDTTPSSDGTGPGSNNSLLGP